MDGVQIFSCPMQCKNGRNGGGFPEQERAGSGSASPSVDRNKVGVGIYAVFQIAFDPSGRYFDADGSSAGKLAEGIHRFFQIFFRIDLFKPAGALNVIARIFSTESGDFGSYFFSRKMSSHAGFCPLTDLDFDSVRRLQVFIGHAVFIWNIFKNILIGRLLFFGKDAAFSAAHSGFGQGAAFGQGYLDFSGKRSEGHMGNIDGAFQHHRFLRMLSDDGSCTYRIRVKKRSRI